MWIILAGYFWLSIVKQIFLMPPSRINSFTASGTSLIADDVFFNACRIGDVDVIKSSLEKISVHSRDRKGNTCLIIASGRGRLEVLRILLAHGGNPEDATMAGIFEGKTAIW